LKGKKEGKKRKKRKKEKKERRNAHRFPIGKKRLSIFSELEELLKGDRSL
jgi:hypothetical protein